MHIRNEMEQASLMAEDRSTLFLDRLNEHRGIVLKVASMYCRNPSEREDVIQTITAELWRAYARYDSRYRFTTWMYRICVNVAISYYRRESRRAQPIESLDLADIDDSSAEPPTEEDAQRDMLYDFISELNELDRALMLLYLDDLNHADIANVLGISPTNVATKIGRMKLRFRDASNKLAAAKKD